MQTKIYNAYRITHKNGSIEDINALDLVQALENMDTPETESRVLQAILVKESVRTLVEEESAEIVFKAVVKDEITGSIATPSQGKIHSGDEITLKAIPARTYRFVEWQMNGEHLSNDADLLYRIPQLATGIDSIVFTAIFELDDVTWKTQVSPEEATAEGCMTFPIESKTKANEKAGAVAITESTKYQFDHWERNGVNVGTNKVLDVTATPLGEDEKECIFTAVFTTV